MQDLHRSVKERVCGEREAGRNVDKATNYLNLGGAIKIRLRSLLELERAGEKTVATLNCSSPKKEFG